MDPAEARRGRTQEQIASARAVGVDLVEFLDHPDGEVEYGRRLRADLVHAIRRHRPEVLGSLNPHLNTAGGGSNMADHRAVGTAVLDAARDAGNRWLFRRSSSDDLEPWDGVRMVCFAASPSPTHCVDVAEFVEAGIAALKAQHTYIAGLGGGFDPEHYLRDEMSRAGGRAGPYSWPSNSRCGPSEQPPPQPRSRACQRAAIAGLPSTLRSPGASRFQRDIVRSEVVAETVAPAAAGPWPSAGPAGPALMHQSAFVSVQ